MALGGTPMEPGWEGMGDASHLGQGGGGGGVGWGSAESPQAPAGQRGKEAHSRPQAPPWLPAQRPLTPRRAAGRGVDPESGGQAAAPCPCPQGPARWAGEAGPSASQQPRPPAHPALLPGVIFSPRPQPTPLNLSSETGYFSLGGERCQEIGPGLIKEVTAGQWASATHAPPPAHASRPPLAH